MVRSQYYLLFVVLLVIVGCNREPTTQEIRRMSAASLFTDTRVAELVLAAETGDVDRLNRLAKDGVDVNSQGKHKVTPILRSVLAKNRKGYSALLKLGADPNMRDRDGYAAVHLAAAEENPEWLREALDHGAQANLLNTGHRTVPNQTPLFFAISNGRTDNVRMLIKANADVNHASKSGRPLDDAVNQDFEIVLLLLEAGAEYKYDGFGLVESMKLDLKNGLVGRSERSKSWFQKTMKFLEDKGAQFQPKN